MDDTLKRNVFSVEDLTRRIKETLEDSLGQVWVEGEVSNLKTPSSGHMYFTLKDEHAQIAVVLFRGSQKGLSLSMKDGLKIRALGEISVYEARGQYQLIAREVEDAGKGNLQEQFEKLKAQLLQEGLFDPAHKKPLPMLPRKIGIVTSPTGAAIRDMLQVLDRRFPNLHIVLAPVKVQGDGAAQMIARAVEFFNSTLPVDVMIIGRGGGSLEDLWAFNEEVVARAIAASRIPVLSAVGHETDFTISDFVADHRAPTPSAAAELVVGRKEEFESMLRECERRLSHALESTAQTLRHRLVAAARSYVFREPHHLLKQHRQRLGSLEDSMRHSLQQVYRQRQQRVDELGLQLAHRAETTYRHNRQEVARLTAQLKALSPTGVLDRGYSMTVGKDGRVVRSVDDVRTGDMLTTRLARGTVESNVVRILGDGDDQE